MGPDRLDTLSVGHPNPIHIGKVEGRLARRPMPDDVELWNGDAKVEGAYIDGLCRRVLREPILKG